MVVQPREARRKTGAGKPKARIGRRRHTTYHVKNAQSPMDLRRRKSAVKADESGGDSSSCLNSSSVGVGSSGSSSSGSGGSASGGESDSGGSGKSASTSLGGSSNSSHSR